jgi:hypothetical protein
MTRPLPGGRKLGRGPGRSLAPRKRHQRMAAAPFDARTRQGSQRGLDASSVGPRTEVRIRPLGIRTCERRSRKVFGSATANVTQPSRPRDRLHEVARRTRGNGRRDPSRSYRVWRRDPRTFGRAALGHVWAAEERCAPAPSRTGTIADPERGRLSAGCSSGSETCAAVRSVEPLAAQTGTIQSRGASS